MGVAAAILIVGLGWAPQRALIALHRVASPVPVVNTGLVAAIRRLLPLAGISHALGATGVSAHRAHISGLASCANMWNPIATASGTERV
jgi:hypothetical protein